MLPFKEWRLSLGLPEPDLEDLQDLTDLEAGEIYWKKYAEPSGFESLPAGLDYAVLNTAVMQGVSGARSLLSLAQMNWNPDPRTKHGIIAEITNLLLCQASLKMHDPNVGPHRNKKTGQMDHGFGPGWADRIMRVRAKAIAMVK